MVESTKQKKNNLKDYISVGKKLNLKEMLALPYLPECVYKDALTFWILLSYIGEENPSITNEL